MLLMNIRKMISAQQRYRYTVLDHREEKKCGISPFQYIASAHLLWLVHALEYFQCAVAYQLLRSKTLVSAH